MSIGLWVGVGTAGWLAVSLVAFALLRSASRADRLTERDSPRSRPAQPRPTPSGEPIPGAAAAAAARKRRQAGPSTPAAPPADLSPPPPAAA